MTSFDLDDFPTFPPICACCLTPTDGTLEVLSALRASPSMLRPPDQPWQVPYCLECQQHVHHAWQAGGKLFRKGAILGAIVLLPFTPFHILFFVALILVSAVLSIVFLVSRLRMRAVRTGPNCTAPTLAVLRKGPKGDRYGVAIRNDEFARLFRLQLQEAAKTGQPIKT
ncbi:MAG: hypothetical protein KGR26_05625 [Cyanobacteria bacterium REEB65]|nr:hypothetical protein [Cyanobacteria bacterium REEB65]